MEAVIIRLSFRGKVQLNINETSGLVYNRMKLFASISFAHNLQVDP